MKTCCADPSRREEKAARCHTGTEKEMAWTHTERREPGEGCSGGQVRRETRKRKAADHVVRRYSRRGLVRDSQRKSSGQRRMEKMDASDLPQGRTLMMMMIR